MSFNDCNSILLIQMLEASNASKRRGGGIKKLISVLSDVKPNLVYSSGLY